MIFRRSKKIFHRDIDPGEVLLDAQNLPGFNEQQFEGVIEQPISKRAVWIVRIALLLILTVFAYQLGKVQIIEGDKYFTLSEQNRLDRMPIFAERGVIYDRNNVALAWNEPPLPDTPYPTRTYMTPGFAHLLGIVAYPALDTKGYYWRSRITGTQGIEGAFDELLAGKNGSTLIEVDAKGNPTSRTETVPTTPGENIVLTIDAGIQKNLAEGIKALAERAGFVGGAGVILDVHTGEVIALTSYPEYDPMILSRATDTITIAGYNIDPKKPYLNRAVAGAFTPGSTVKPYLALAALQEGIVTPDTSIYSSGKIEIPNRYNPDKPQLFRDWRPLGHGPTNVYHAIADSVNTYFYAIGGGLGNQEGLGITRIEKYARMFGFGQKTGIDIPGEKSGNIPSPAWKDKNFADGTWRLGDTYNSSIGQFGFLATPVQLARAVGGIATSGTLVTPHSIIYPNIEKSETTQIEGISAANYAIIREAMRDTVTEGTAQLLNIPGIEVAAKTGTAQVGVVGSGRYYTNSWVTGFFPAGNPKYSFTVVMERAPSSNQAGAVGAFRPVLDYIVREAPAYTGVQSSNP